MVLIIDTSVILAVLMNERSKPKLIKITKGNELIAPLSLHWEIGNAFSAMFKRKIINIESAKKALEYYLMIPIRLVDVDLMNSIEIANKFGIYAYDAYFLECAKQFNTPLVTLDNRLMKKAKQMNIKIMEV